MKNGAWILAATILGSSLAFIDGTVVNVALPALQTALHATVSDVQWVVESYALLLASLLLVGGSLGDLYGRRKVFVCGVILFAAASIWCGTVSSIDRLIFARAIQGIGAALLVPGSLALISASFPADARGRRWVFFINAPIAAVALALTLWKVPESRHNNISRVLDWQGALLATVGLGAVTFALIEAPKRGAAAGVVGLAGIVALAAFIVVESRSPSPMLSLQLFRSRNFSGANLLTFFLYAALGGIFFFVPLNLIQVQHYTPTQAGGALLPLILIIFLLSRWSGGLIARYGARTPLTAGPLIAALWYFLLLIPGIGGEYWRTIFPGIAVLGLGMAVCIAPLTTAVMSAVSQNQAGVASGVNNAVSRVAGLLAVAVFGLVLYATFSRALDHRIGFLSLPRAEVQQVNRQRPNLAAIESDDPRVMLAVGESFMVGYRTILWLAVALSLASAVAARWLLDPAEKAP